MCVISFSSLISLGISERNEIEFIMVSDKSFTELELSKKHHLKDFESDPIYEAVSGFESLRNIS